MSSNHRPPTDAGPPPCRDRARAAQTCDEATVLLDDRWTFESAFSAVSPGTARSARPGRPPGFPGSKQVSNTECSLDWFAYLSLSICFTFSNVASAA